MSDQMSEEKFRQDYLHAYPGELVSFVLKRLREPIFAERFAPEGGDPSAGFPDHAALEHLVSVCYQASLMREEERQTRFRLIVREPHLFSSDDGPPTGLHRLQFAASRPFTEHELCRLAPAADYYRTLIGVSPSGREETRIWGIIHSGTRWMQPLRGGTKAVPLLPPAPVIHVGGPGCVSVSIGSEMIASLSSGKVCCPSQDVFSMQWFQDIFASERSEIWELHLAERARAKKPWADLDPDFGRFVARQVARRIVSLIRDSHHGGMLVYLPTGSSREILSTNRLISLKYPFHEGEPRRRFRTLILRIMNTFAELRGDTENHGKPVGWQEYVGSSSETIALLDEAIFDLAHFIAALSAIDGAVVMTKRQDLLGFGGVISGNVFGDETVAHALDMEGRLTRQEPVEEAGTRHRSAYRLCHELHDAFVVVVSQDGNARFVKWHNGAVTYWDMAPTGVPGF